MKNQLFLMLAVMLLAISAPLSAETYYVTPKGAGTMDGSSWENAMTEKELSKALNTAEGEATVFMRGGWYGSLNVKNSGLESLTIFGGMDGKEAKMKNCRLKTDEECWTHLFNLTVSRTMELTKANSYKCNHPMEQLMKISDMVCTHIFVSPEGTGKKDGSSERNALPQAGLSTALEKAKGDVYIFLCKGSYAPMEMRLNKETTSAWVFGNFGGESIIESEGRDLTATVFTVQSDRQDKKVRVHLKNLTAYGNADFGNTEMRIDGIDFTRTGNTEQLMQGFGQGH